MFLLREARAGDLSAILELAEHLDSPNLPADETFLRGRLERATRAFAKPGPPAASREYQFVLVDAADAVVGTCAILAKHGTPGMPHVYLTVGEEERSSATAHVHLKHRTFTLGYTEDGPSEIGALVLHPDARRTPGSPGKLLSWGRFAYVARHPDRFERRVLAEMRANLDAEGRNRFWDAFGRRFTGMTYAEADRRSAEDKSFILDLFPSTPFYASLLDDEVAREIGEVHPETRPALALLERAGFQWVGEIDPFDAGPFFGAATAAVLPVRESRSGVLADAGPEASARRWIVSVEGDEGFRAVVSAAEIDEEGEVRLEKEARERLRVAPGSSVGIVPFPERREARSG